jgi:hypothetical protein
LENARQVKKIAFMKLCDLATRSEYAESGAKYFLVNENEHSARQKQHGNFSLLVSRLLRRQKTNPITHH